MGEGKEKKKKGGGKSPEKPFTKDGVRVQLHSFENMLTSVPELAGLFDPGLEPHLEIEDQFEITAVPKDLDTISLDGVKDMTQGYIWFQARPKGDAPPKPFKVRVRAYADHGKTSDITYKTVRKVPVAEGIDQEYEHVVSQKTFQDLNALRSGMLVHKTRFYIPHNYVEPGKEHEKHYHCQIHLDMFRSVGDVPARFVRAEIEFPSVEARAFFLADPKKRLPKWIGRKVDKETERAHASTYIALHGLPLTNGKDVEGVDALYNRLNQKPFLAQI